jgi:hypothetical protein
MHARDEECVLNWSEESLGRPRRRWEDNIKLIPKEVVCEGVDWLYLTQDTVHWRALVNMVMNFQVP